jgi:hypothetical protein
MQDQPCPTSPPTLVLALQITVRCTDASCDSFDAVLMIPTIAATATEVALRVTAPLRYA